MIIDCSQPWYDLIKNGKKPIEGKKGTPKWSSINVDDLVIFRDPDNLHETFTCKVININKYTGYDALDKYLLGETLERSLPGVTNYEEGKKIYLQWSTEQEIAQYGMLAIHIQPT